jgi:non-specific protein-tyrosine kinase
MMPQQNQGLRQLGEGIDLNQYIAIIRHWGLLIIVVTLISAAVSFIISTQITPVYNATTTIMVNQAPAVKSSDYNSILSSERLTRTYAQMLTKQSILEEVKKRLNLSIELEQLSKVISVAPTRDTQLIEITVESTNPVQAAQIANMMVTVFSEEIQQIEASRFAVSKQNLQTQMTDIEKQIQQLTDQRAGYTEGKPGPTPEATDREKLDAKLAQYRQIYSNLVLSYEQVRLSEAQNTSNVVQVEPATPAKKPIRPQLLLNTFIAAAVGLLLSISAIFVIETLDDSLKTPDEVNQLLGLPVLGVILNHPSEDGRPISQEEPRSPVSEAFRTLRTNVQYTSVDHPPRVILVTSPTPGEGKTTVITNLAIVLAQSGRHVAIIDADMRRPTVHRKLGLNNHNGLSSLFVKPDAVLSGTLKRTPITNLSVITSGHLPPNPSELLGSQKMNTIIEALKMEVDIILIDTPPTNAVTDAAVLGSVVDGILLVMRPGITKQAAARQCVEQLRRVNAKILGVILNNIETKSSRYGYYYQRAYQGYTPYYYYGENKKEKAQAPNNG